MKTAHLGHKALVTAALVLQAGAGHAAPVTYSFSTLSGPFGSGGLFELFAPGSSASGTFVYDAAASATGTTPTGATVYGILNNPPTFSASFSNLTGTVNGFSFSDARGTTLVGNDNHTGGLDILQLNAQSTTPINGFSIGGYTLVNVRMFWIESQAVPGTVPDFLSGQALPGTLPGFQGRLAFDFVQAANPTGPQSFLFYDGLSVAPVPEPETYAMLLAGLGLLALTAHRRRRAG